MSNHDQKRRWYRDISTVIAVVAILISCGTFVLNEHRNYWTGRATMKARLIEQMDRFFHEAETAHLRQLSETNPAASFAINAIWESRKEVLVNDLLWLSERIPDDIEPSEYLALAGIFVNDARYEDATRFASEGLKRANSVRERMEAKQRIGRNLYPRSEFQDIARGRELLRESANWYAQRSEERDVLQAGFIYARWAELEAQHGTLEEAARLTELALQQNKRLLHVRSAVQQVLLLSAKLSKLRRGERPSQ